MSMYDSFNRDNVKVMKKAMQVALEPLGKQFGMSFEVNITSFNNASLLAKLDCVIGENANLEQTEFNRLCQKYGLKEHHYRKDFVHAGKTYRVIGFNTKAPKNPFKIEDDKGDCYRAPASIIRNTLLVQFP